MKRIVICADGTWNSPESDYPTNVLRLSRAISPHDAVGDEQVVFYDWGVGTDRKKLAGGISGAGINKNIMDSYRFIVQNYDPGDALFFFGFSRGAYTVRSLAGFIRNAGLLRREHAGRIGEAFNLYRKRTKKSHPDEAAAKTFRRKYALADRAEIQFVGVWDTVGALGVPMPFLGTLGDEKFMFHDTQPSRIVRCARHAVSLDENREDFNCTLWQEEKVASDNLDLKQVWFPGVHADVGGGYRESDLSDIAFQWLIGEAKQKNLLVEDHLLRAMRPRPLGKQHNEYKGIYRLRSRYTRDLIPPDADKHELAKPLVHRSAKTRWDRSTDRKKCKSLKRFFETHNATWDDIDLVG